MLVRRATYDDLDRMKELFACARAYMKKSGNPTQWKDDRPSISIVVNDIAKNNSYVIEDDDRIVATFACIKGIEPTYLDIDGKWLNDDEYVTIHRVASDGSRKGIFNEIIKYCGKFNRDIRIDTHKDNKTMIHLIEKNGFRYCGIIIVDDGTKRIAFQKKI